MSDATHESHRVPPRKTHHGYVDAISEDMSTVAGWIGVRDGEVAPLLDALGKNVETRKASIGGERTDVTAATGVANRSFRLQLSRPVTALEILSGTLQIVSRLDVWETPVPFSGGIIGRAKRETLGQLIKECPDDAQALGLQGTDELDALRANAYKVEAAARDGSLARVAFPVGLESRDGSAMLGYNGYIYLVKGSNNLLAQYCRPESVEGAKALEGNAQAWATLVRTPLLERVNELLCEEPSYVDGVKVFDARAGPAAPNQRNDSHCSPAGSLAAAGANAGCTPRMRDRIP